jgi:hypothetical protein
MTSSKATGLPGGEYGRDGTDENGDAGTLSGGSLGLDKSVDRRASRQALTSCCLSSLDMASTTCRCFAPPSWSVTQGKSEEKQVHMLWLPPLYGPRLHVHAATPKMNMTWQIQHSPESSYRPTAPQWPLHWQGLLPPLGDIVQLRLMPCTE